MTKELVALLGGREIGRVRQDPRGRLSFTYDDRWRRAPGAYPLSLSMPLAASEHGAGPVEAFLWGLLPDNLHILERWGRRFRVSPRNAFALLAYVGEECAGAVQFVRLDRLKTLRGPARKTVQWLETADVAERLRALRTDQSAWRQPGDTGQFSLAGAQPKTALLLDKGRWGVPSGRMPQRSARFIISAAPGCGLLVGRVLHAVVLPLHVRARHVGHLALAQRRQNAGLEDHFVAADARRLLVQARVVLAVALGQLLHGVGLPHPASLLGAGRRRPSPRAAAGAPARGPARP